MVHCRDWCIFTLTTWFTGNPYSFLTYLDLFCSPPPHFWQETKQIEGRKHKLCCLRYAYAMVLVLTHCASCCSPASNNAFSLKLFCLRRVFPDPSFSPVWSFLSQGCEGRKHLVDRARSGQTGRLWLGLYCGSSQLLRGNTLLVKHQTSVSLAYSLWILKEASKTNQNRAYQLWYTRR